jgi:hypothetical protein
MSKVVYLCGPINGCTDDECTTWREQAKSRQGLGLMVNTLDPMRRDYRGREDDCVNEIVELDKIDVRDSTVVLAMCPKPSVGTSMEIFYAWTIGVPVFSVVPEGSPVSPWLKYHSTRVCKTLEEACTAIKEL